LERELGESQHQHRRSFRFVEVPLTSLSYEGNRCGFISFHMDQLPLVDGTACRQGLASVHLIESQFRQLSRVCRRGILHIEMQ
jgi:hypothetical protein